MSVAMKNPHIEEYKNYIEKKALVLRLSYNGGIYDIPKINLNQYKVDVASTATCHVDAILSENVFADLDRENTKAGILLQGIRNREGLTQKEFAKKISILQADLSKMEHGKRPIGKTIAKRIEKIFGVSYRYFLG